MFVDYMRLLYDSGLNVFPCRKIWRREAQKWDKQPVVRSSWKNREDPGRRNWSSELFGVEIPEGVLVIDVDTQKGVNTDAIDRLLGTALPWQDAYLQTTISGGYHFAFKCPWAARQGDSLNGLSGFDTRAAGRGFICSGEGYQPYGTGILRLAQPQLLPAVPDAARGVLERRERPKKTVPPPRETSTTNVHEALRHIPPGCSRDVWISVGMALRSHFKQVPSEGLELFREWSSGALTGEIPDNYVPDDIDFQWDHISPDGGTNINTLFYHAINEGWAPPRTFDSGPAFSSGQAADRSTFQGLVDKIREKAGETKNVPGLIDEVQRAGCDAIQTALLACEIKTAMRDAGQKDHTVGRLLDRVLSGQKNQLPYGEKPGDTYLEPQIPLDPMEWAPHQTKGKEMKPKGTMDNFEIMRKAYGVRIYFDEIRKELCIKGPSVRESNGVLKDEAALSFVEHLANLNDYPTQSLRSMIVASADRNTFNPVKEWVESAPWDGLDHIGALWGQIRLDPSEDPEFCEILFRKWMRGAYAIGTGVISRWEYVLVLIDPEGGTGKTRFFSTLCEEGLMADSSTLEVHNKDSVKMAISYWLNELGELDGTFSKSDHARLKAFLSAKWDELRLPYGRAYLKFPRRTAFMASVNEPHYLVDLSGNRRWWGMSVTGANHTHKVNVQQAWAQAAQEVSSGRQIFLTPQEEQILKKRNEAHRMSSPISDALGRLALEKSDADLLSVAQILAASGVTRATRADMNEASRWLASRGYKSRMRHGCRVYEAKLAAPGTQSFMMRSI